MNDRIHPARRLRFAPFRPRPIGAAVALAAVALAQGASAQITFSIDWKSASLAQPDSTQPNHRLMTESDLMRPGPGSPGYGTSTNPLEPPTILVLGAQLGLSNYQSCVGHPAGTDCNLEVDSLSGGHDTRFVQGQTGLAPVPRRRIWFSVDEFAAGHPATATAPPHATVRNQGAPGTPPPVFEACADVFVDTNLPSGPLGPLPPPAYIPNNAGTFDGDGQRSTNGFVYPGLGLIEPSNVTGPFPTGGDNLDALDIGSSFAPGTVAYLSLDSAFLDPLLGLPNTGSASANGFRGGDVLRITIGAPGSTLSVYATATQLGLDLHGAPDSDDLDALILAENGSGVYEPSLLPYDWNTGATDMLIFSVRRGSAVIGHPDSIFGVPIEPGDLLVPPIAGGNGNPGIYIAAERLGLRTSRSHGVPHGDDMDAVDVTEELCYDCNENGVEDSVDIATGASSDMDGNGIPDECEDGVVEFCLCPATAPAPCNNFDGTAGCQNSTGVGAKTKTNITSGGSVSVALDNLVITTTQAPTSVSGLFFMGPESKPPTPFEDGLRCIGSPVLRYALQNSGPTGTYTLGPGLIATAAARFGPVGTINSGESWYFQTWYRDPNGPCNQNSNLSNAIKATFEP
jgi:hypothetical protein